MDVQAPLVLTPTSWSRRCATGILPLDAAVLTGEFAEDLAPEFRQALATGVVGWLDDDLAFTRP